MNNLNTLLNALDFDALPPAWTTFDLARFSKQKALWDYQQAALKNALKALWMYYDDLLDYAPGEGDQAVSDRKARFLAWYRQNDVPLPDALPVNSARKRDLTRLLEAYYPVEDDSIPYQHLINRIGFWMATGSGKTLVLVRLIEFLWRLMQLNEIPPQDVLVLTCREDLLDQLRDMVADYNAGGGPLHMRLRELKEYPEAKRENPSLLAFQEITVFYYRSDNLSDEQKDRIIDFRNYDNNGHWYLLLDEAHRGDKEDSKRQHIYNILSRNGFLFNFSATFTDERDILTTAAEFNLASFTGAGYGKHLALFQQEIRAFRPKEDFTFEEKQRMVLKSLLMLAYVRKARERLCEVSGTVLYHRPMMLALTNSTNTEEADLKLFFNELARIAKSGVSSELLSRARRELLEELQSGLKLLFEDENFIPDISMFQSLTLADVLNYAFNAPGLGEIEVISRKSNVKELAFKLQNSASAFALVRIGNTADWFKNFLVGYSSVETFETESYFENLNREDSEINMLMGSRSFYEGWDSNRPNVINFINIGMNEDTKKFILQSVGRGVRIEPIPSQRKRMKSLFNAGIVAADQYTQAKPFLPAVETLFIFGTNRDALNAVLTELKKEQVLLTGEEISLPVNSAAIQGKTLLIPTYHNAGQLLAEKSRARKFELPQDELDLLKNYVNDLVDDRLLLAVHDMLPAKIRLMHNALESPEKYFNPQGDRRFGNLNILIPRILQYFSTIPREVDGFKPLEEEIRHFRHIRVELKDLAVLNEKITKVANYEDPKAKAKEMLEKAKRGEVSIEDALSSIDHNYNAGSAEEEFTPPGKSTLKIKHIAAHYYLPVLVADDEKIDYIQHIIRVPSEVRFIAKLESALKDGNDPFSAYDWWLFSRTDETLDEVGLPYYDPKQNKIRDFHPDFVFWMQKGDDYRIIFVDPKGFQNTDYEYKVDGYRELFEDAETGEPKIFKSGSKRVTVRLILFTGDDHMLAEGYRNFWKDRIEQIGV